MTEKRTATKVNKRMIHIRLRWLWLTRLESGKWVAWLCIGGRKPLAHLPAWRRRWLHLPSVRVRLI